MYNFFRTKNIKEIEKTVPNTNLARTLTTFDLVLMGIGVIMGTGIFVFTGIGAAKYAGPGIIVSFVLSGLTCAFSGLAYAELSSMVTLTGSVYTYAYATLGELVAWTVGWALIVEYSFAAATVAAGWSQYIIGLINNTTLGAKIPLFLQKVPAENGLINLTAVFLVILLCAILYIGTKASARFNKFLVFLKLSTIIIFIIFAAPHVNPKNWNPFFPFGLKGVLSGASIAFFAYIGFDVLANSAEECKDPVKSIPRAIFFSLLIVTILYIIVTAIMTGVVPYYKLTAAPVNVVLSSIGYNFGKTLLGYAIIFGLTTVVLLMLYSQIRLFLAMSRDGLLPRFLGKIHSQFKTPHILTFITCIFVSLLVGFIKLELLAELVNTGTLFAFIVASIGVAFLRITKPDIPRPFKCPIPYIIMPLSIILCLILMFTLSLHTWLAFTVWTFIGLLIYLLYGYKNSELSSPCIKIFKPNE